MEEYSFRYQNGSPEKMTRAEKIQLLLPGLSICLVGLENFDNPELIFKLIGSFHFLIGFLHVLFFIKYQSFKTRLGNYFLKSLHILTGAVMVVDAISYFYQGKNLLPWVTLALGLFYIFALEKLIRYVTYKKTITLTPVGIALGKFFTKDKEITWDRIESLTAGPEMVGIKIADKKLKRFYISEKSNYSSETLKKLLSDWDKESLLEEKYK